MKLSKLTSIGLILAMTVSAAACGSTAAGADVAVSSASSVSAVSEKEEKAASAASEAKKKAASAASEAEEKAESAASEAEEKAESAASEAEEKAASAASEAEEEAVSAVSDVAAGEEISPDDISVRWEDSRVFMDLSLGRYKRITTYEVKGYEDVPFIPANVYLDILLEGKEQISTEDGVMTVYINGTEAVIDPAEDTVTIENAARFRSTGKIDGAIVEEAEYNVVTESVKNQSVQKDASPITISLKDYHMPVIAYEDTVLMPFLALQNTFGAARMQTLLAYNGKDYYNVFESEYFAANPEHTGATDSPYLKAAFSGPFSEMEKTSQAYADYGYYSVCLLLDLTYGHKEEKNITTFDEYFTRLNAKKAMTSTNPGSAMTGELLLFNYLFDSGHDSIISYDNVFHVEALASLKEAEKIAEDIKESEEGSELFDEHPEAVPDPEDMTNNAQMLLGALMEKGLKVPEVVPLLAWSFFMEELKPEDYGSERLDFSGDTAVIFFDAFKDDSKRDPSYYLDPIKEGDEENSTFVFFHECFEEIQKHEEVKNVVINLSDNGGGSAAALVAVLGFLSEDGEVRLTLQDLMAGNYREECYHVDTNLDGISDDLDGFGGQYDFYILCSHFSYSCGNALPYYAQKEGLADIIGTTPGGGDCVVGYFVDAYGRCACYSGMLKLGAYEGTEFISDEKATTLDLNMLPSIWDITNVPWFDADGIADAVHQYQDGAAEIVYSDKSEKEKMTDFLIYMLNKIERTMEANGLLDEAGTGEMTDTESQPETETLSETGTQSETEAQPETESQPAAESRSEVKEAA